jgi:hypothetical protein
MCVPISLLGDRMREALRGALYNPRKEDYDAITRILLAYYTVYKAQRRRREEALVWHTTAPRVYGRDDLPASVKYLRFLGEFFGWCV